MDDMAHLVPPADIEAPVPILFWEPVEFIVALTLAGFGMLAQMFPLGIVLAASVLVGARYLKRGAKRGAVQHFLWSMGLQLDPGLKSKFPPAWVNEFIE